MTTIHLHIEETVITLRTGKYRRRTQHAGLCGVTHGVLDGRKSKVTCLRCKKMMSGTNPQPKETP